MLATAFLAAALASTAFASASPAVVKRSLPDTDRCLDVRHLGIIDLNVGLDLGLLGKGRKTPCSQHKCGFAPYVPARGHNLDLCVDINLLGFVEVDVAAQLGLLERGMKRVSCKKSTACPRPGSGPKPHRPVKTVTVTKTAATKTVTKTAATKTATKTVTEAVATQTLTQTLTNTVTSTPATQTLTQTLTNTVTSTPATQTVTNTVTNTVTQTVGPALPTCTPLVLPRKRQVVGAGLCVSVPGFGLISSTIATTLNVLGLGTPVACGTGCGLPVFGAPVAGDINIGVCVNLPPLGLVSVGIATQLNLLLPPLLQPRVDCVVKAACPCIL